MTELLIIGNKLTAQNDGTVDVVEQLFATPMSEKWKGRKARRFAPVLGVPGVVGTALAHAFASSDRTGMQFRYREPAKGCWVVHNTGWTFNSPRGLKHYAADLLHRWSKAPMSACFTAVEIGIGNCYSEWQFAVMDHFGPRPIDGGEFHAGDCDICGRRWWHDRVNSHWAYQCEEHECPSRHLEEMAPGGRWHPETIQGEEVWVRTDYSSGWNGRRSACKECWKKEELEDLQPDLTWHEGTCAKCGATSGEHKAWVVSNLFGDKDVCQNCYESFRHLYWCICPVCSERGVSKNSARPFVEDLEVVHECATCGHKF